MKYVLFLPLAFAICQPALAQSPQVPKITNAEIKGESYLGQLGNEATIVLKNAKCVIKAVGESGKEGEAPRAFRIEISCGGKKQTLWDISKPAADDFAFDDPRFQLLWAGDRDGDGKIDLEMEMSPKYSCTKKVRFLSSKAGTDQIVGPGNKPKTECPD